MLRRSWTRRSRGSRWAALGAVAASLFVLVAVLSAGGSQTVLAAPVAQPNAAPSLLDYFRASPSSAPDPNAADPNEPPVATEDDNNNKDDGKSTSKDKGKDDAKKNTSEPKRKPNAQHSNEFQGYQKEANVKDLDEQKPPRRGRSVGKAVVILCVCVGIVAVLALSTLVWAKCVRTRRKNEFLRRATTRHPAAGRLTPPLAATATSASGSQRVVAAQTQQRPLGALTPLPQAAPSPPPHALAAPRAQYVSLPSHPHSTDSLPAEMVSVDQLHAQWGPYDPQQCVVYAPQPIAHPHTLQGQPLG